MRYLWLVLILAGCAQKLYYLPDISARPHYHSNVAIGVVDIDLPEYLLIDTILVKGKKERYEPFPIAGEPDEILTDRLISYLKVYLGDKRIFHYPWLDGPKPSCILRLHISSLYLDEESQKLAIVAHYLGKDVIIKKRLKKDLRQTMDQALNSLYQRVAEDIATQCIHHKGR